MGDDQAFMAPFLLFGHKIQIFFLPSTMNILSWQLYYFFCIDCLPCPSQDTVCWYRNCAQKMLFSCKNIKMIRETLLALLWIE